ncbi:MAG: hypothetical protein Q4D89_14595, partial [Arachnia propionica]|uniref:hypothetical protein n=1 Tax=Arachnia propionica TaxID=1750 RepID=UPI002702AAA8|nr:hypothetical protein [Arachnia propionica]
MKSGKVVRVAFLLWVGVRSLRTQQRALSQCQFFCVALFFWVLPLAGLPCLWWFGWIPLILMMDQFLVCGQWLDSVLTACAGACVVLGVLIFFDGEFDPGSGRTLAACLTHA